MSSASSADFASVLTKNRSYVGAMFALARRLLVAVTTVAAIAALAGSAMAQSNADSQTGNPALKPVRSIPYVSITGEDGQQRHYETNAIPLLFNRACFGWRMYLGGPTRVVSLKEVLTTSEPAAQALAGPATGG